MTEHPITPPVELVKQWREESSTGELHFSPQYLAVQAARWGADQQLAEDAKWMDQHALDAPHLKITPVGKSLIEAMRPKPPSLKEQALEALGADGYTMLAGKRLEPVQLKIIRRALEALPND